MSRKAIAARNVILPGEVTDDRERLMRYIWAIDTPIPCYDLRKLAASTRAGRAHALTKVVSGVNFLKERVEAKPPAELARYLAVEPRATAALVRFVTVPPTPASARARLLAAGMFVEDASDNLVRPDPATEERAALRVVQEAGTVQGLRRTLDRLEAAYPVSGAGGSPAADDWGRADGAYSPVELPRAAPAPHVGRRRLRRDQG